MRAIVLLSGGVDSTVALGLALEMGRECIALSFDYGQKHRIELNHAKKIAEHYGVEHIIIKIDNQTFKNTALVESGIESQVESGIESQKEHPVPKNRTPQQMQSGEIPVTYVPARNTLFLAYAMGQAEIFEAEEIYFGPNADDHQSYPDCRPAFYDAFQKVIEVGSKQAVEGKAPKLIAPLIEWNKKEIVAVGRRLGAPLDLTFSCYDPDRKNGNQHCGKCDACYLRKEAGL